MKTIEQILEGVTAGGKWHADKTWLVSGGGKLAIAFGKEAEIDVRYAAWAARNAPGLARALEALLEDIKHDHDPVQCQSYEAACTALAEALKD